MIRILSLILAVSTLVAAEEACHSFAGGHVYPGETPRSTAHAVHWSKVQSKFSSCLVFLPVPLYQSVAYLAQLPGRGPCYATRVNMVSRRGLADKFDTINVSYDLSRKK